MVPRIKVIHPKKPKRKFDPSLYSTRRIALRIAYLGGNYTGFEYHANSPNPTNTIEEHIFKALLKARLVPSNGIEGEEETVLGWPGDEVAEYSKCGRTDTGVSAFGQVIGVRVRSNRPLPKKPTDDVAEGDDGGEKGETEFDDEKDELPYLQVLNRLLPKDIRALAWCPHPPPGFSARFNCQQRHYRYFFTNPALAPSPNSTVGSLDIDKMREAAKLYIGNHDFRNFCKLDPSKQITRFDRIIHHADIVELPQSSPNSPKVYYFELHGSAFLWHQVRNMIAILFLIAQGLEQPSLVTEMLDIPKNPRKPMYEMAADRALVLWDCVFPGGMLQWLYACGTGVGGRNGILDDVWSKWHKSKIDEILTSGLMKIVSANGDPASNPALQSAPPMHGLGEFSIATQKMGVAKWEAKGKSQILVEGGHEPLFRGTYIPVLERKRMEDIKVLNARYVEKKGNWQENGKKRKAKRKAADISEEEIIQTSESL
ncbi:tRNA pseudouridine synthase [Tuber magnatum]|uniref:tRNA pseudouridine synthase n=1 Tax=Tuber magnatum TaxID=42249 RepID=A0A317SKA0_9PEZI|nr:tRNA pseudouridine synthase [Tuber magnatum]